MFVCEGLQPDTIGGLWGVVIGHAGSFSREEGVAGPWMMKSLMLRCRDAETVLREYGEYSVEHVRQCEEILAEFLSSDLMKKVKRSFCEVPFVVTVDGRPVTGKIDRLCEMENGGWVVIDYKSEVGSIIESASFIQEYEISIQIYMNAIEQILGIKFVNGFLYSTDTGDFFLK